MKTIKLFISYARQDGRELALRLFEDLQTSGHSVWLDTSGIGGGASWSSAIERAIDSCDVALILLSAGSYVSEICRGEQLRALRQEKRVIPLLVQSDADRPVYLEHLNYRDFSDPAHYCAALDALLTEIATGEIVALPEKHRHTLVTAPPCPTNYIERPDDLEKLRQAVLGDDTDRQIALTALRGMGGIGKSVLAAALCHDEAIQAAFPDGVLWVTLGREPGSLVEPMKDIGTALGDALGHYTSETAATARLRTLLPDRAVLIVLDDVWDARHVEPFRVNAPRCRTLITTRDSSIGLALGAPEVRLGVLTPEQARALLREWVGHADPAFGDIAERLGYLPLALKLAGARLHEGMTGAEWLATFQHVAQMKLSRRSTDPKENLQVCFDLSVDRLPEEDRLLYYALGIFPEDEWVPQHVVTRLWQQITPALSAFDADELVTDLARLALIERNADLKTIALHDLLHDYTRSKLGDRLVQTHSDLLAAYNPNSRPWYEIPHDGYLYFYLAYHLRAAGRRAELHDLLTASPDWMEAKFAACVGDTSYTADLALALADFADPLPSEQLSIVVQLHTARQVIHARVSSYTDTDLKTLVWLGRQQEALSHARLRSEPRQQFNGLMAIYEIQKQRDQADVSLLDECYLVAVGIQEEWRRAEALSTVAAALAQAGQFEQARAVAESIQDERERASVLHGLAAILAKSGHCDQATELFTRIRGVTDSIPDAFSQAFALSSLAVDLTRMGHRDQAMELFTRTREIADSIPDGRDQGFALRVMAAALVQAGQLEQAREVADSIPEEFSRAFALSDLAVDLVESEYCDQATDLFNRTREVADSIPEEFERAFALSALASALAKAGHYAQAREVADSIPEEFERASALRVLAAALAEAGHYAQAREVADSIPECWRTSALRGLVAALAEAGHYAQAREIVDSIPEEFEQAEALSDLAAALAKVGYYTQAREVADSIQEGRKRVSALSDLAAALAEVGQSDQATELFTRTHEVADSIQEESARAFALRDLAVALAEAGQSDQATELFTRTREVADSIQKESERVSALYRLFTVLADVGYYGQAREVADSIPEEFERVSALRVLAATLVKAGHYGQAREIVDSIPEEFEQAEALSDLAAALAKVGYYTQAREVADSIQEVRKRVSALSGLAADLAEAGCRDQATDIFTRTREVVDSIQEESARVFALRDLAVALAEAGCRDQATEIFTRMREVVDSIQEESARAEALSDLAAALAKAGQTGQAIELLEQVRTVAEDFQDEESRAYALRDVAAALAQVGQFEQAREVAEGIQAEEWRAGALRDLAAALTKVGYYAQAREIAEGIQDTKALIAVVAALAQAGEFEQARVVAEGMQEEGSRAEALCAVAAALAQVGQTGPAIELLEQARAVAEGMQEEERRAEALRAVADALAQAEHIVMALDTLGPRTLDEFIQTISEWSLPPVTLREVTRVAGWVSSGWREVYEILTTVRTENE